MTNEKLFILLMIFIIIHTIVDCISEHQERKQLEDQLKEHIDYKFNLMKTDIRDIVDEQFSSGICQIEDANRALCKDVELKVASVSHIDSKVIYNSLEKYYERFTSFANHLGEKYVELIALIKPENKPEEVMASLDEVVDTISKMKKEK